MLGKTNRCWLSCENALDSGFFLEENERNGTRHTKGDSSGHEKPESMLKDGRSELHKLPLKYLRDITDNFSDDKRWLGEGGFGTVYKGVLQNGEEIAIKKFNSSIPKANSSIPETMDKRFENEAKNLMGLKHPNVVLLIGWCSEAENTYAEYKGKYVCAMKQQRLLCFEYMPKGDLCGYLSDEFSGLGWDARYKIIEGICYGLRHLHEEWQPNAPIVHMDLKPANILLDNNMMPKIADLGLSRLFGKEKTWTLTASLNGTLGYMSPEYINKGLISRKSDIFSLGVIIIEIVTGRRDYPDETETPSEEFIETVLLNWSQREGVNILFGVSLETVNYEQIRRCIQIGLDCVKTDWSKRPTISQIINALYRPESANFSNIKGVDRPQSGKRERICGETSWMEMPAKKHTPGCSIIETFTMDLHQWQKKTALRRVRVIFTIVVFVVLLKKRGIPVKERQGKMDSPATPSNTSGLFLPPNPRRCVWLDCPIIVGAGPSGLAVAACLREQGVPYIILERADCIASLWQKRTYGRLKLHLAKQFCELPGMPFPDHYPFYPTPRQFIKYFEHCVAEFEIKPEFSTNVLSARYHEASELWRVVAASSSSSAPANNGGDMEYISRWLIVATGVNAETVVPDNISRLDAFDGMVTHVCDYKSSEAYAGKRVLVMGCGNSEMEVSRDLSDHGVHPTMVVHDAVHVLPHEVLGKFTLELAVLLMRWLPLWIVDKIMVLLAWLVHGNLTKLGLRRPAAGPFELMLKHGITPVLDYGALACIRAGDIAIVPAVTRFGEGGQVELADGRTLNFDAVILATRYRSNVSRWLQGTNFFNNDGYPRIPFPYGWKGESRLYAVGFTQRGLSISNDAVRIAKDIGIIWREETKPTKRAGACHRRHFSVVF